MIDTHAHLYFCEDPVEALLGRATDVGVSDIVNVATDLKTAEAVWQVSRQHQGLHATVGVHPCSAHTDWDESGLITLLERGGWVAIGEVGLDYYWSTDHIDIQKSVFELQLKLAKQYRLPVIIHNRQADDDVLALCQAYPEIPKVCHCFSSGPELAQKLLDAGCWLSFTGMITFSKRGKVVSAIRETPIEKIMIETDCPYLTPQKYKGTKNEPAFVVEVAQKIAEIKGVPVSEVAAQTTANARAFFQI